MTFFGGRAVISHPALFPCRSQSPHVQITSNLIATALSFNYKRGGWFNEPPRALHWLSNMGYTASTLLSSGKN